MKRLRYVIAYTISAAVLIFALYMHFNGPQVTGTNLEKSGKDTVYYFPDDSGGQGGYVPFNCINSKDKTGTAVLYSPHPNQSWGFVSEKDNDCENAPSYSIPKKDMGSSLYGYYYDDGRLGAVVYLETGRDNDYRNVHYILVRAYDRDGERIEDTIELCAQTYVADIASTLAYKFGNEKICRIYLQPAYNTVDRNHIEIKVLTEDGREFSFDDAEKVRLLDLNGTDSWSILKSIIACEGDDKGFEISEKTAARIAELLNSGMGEDFIRAEDFSAETVETVRMEDLF